MKKGRMINFIQKVAIFLCVALVMGSIPWADAGQVEARNSKKYEQCSLDSVTVSVSGDTVTYKAGLQPYAVEQGVDLLDYILSMEIQDYTYVKSAACARSHNGDMLRGYVKDNEGDWQEFLTSYDGEYREDAPMPLRRYTIVNMPKEYLESVISANTAYLELNFAFGTALYEAEDLIVHLAHGYHITYDLAGGTFAGEKLDMYTSYADYPLPVPTREGYEFGGWTGTGLAEPTKEVVIEKGTTGDRSYKATWKKVENTTEPTPPTEPTEPTKPTTPTTPSITPNTDTPSVGAKVEDEKGKADYVVTKATEKVMEVAYAAPAKKAKNVTIPATVTLKGGQKAKVTSIAKNAFKNNKTVQTVTIGKNVKSIGNAAFMGCTKLTKVTIGKNVSSIGAKAFHKCKKLKTINVKTTKLALKNVDKKAFKGIHKNATVTVPAKKYKSYKTILEKRGAGKKVTVKKKK